MIASIRDAVFLHDQDHPESTENRSLSAFYDGEAPSSHLCFQRTSLLFLRGFGSIQEFVILAPRSAHAELREEKANEMHQGCHELLTCYAFFGESQVGLAREILALYFDLMALKIAYVPCSSSEEAKRIGRILIEEKLAACVNIVDQVASIYRGGTEGTEGTEGANTQESMEVLLLVKTTDEHVDALIKRIEELHSYDCPCIAVLDVEKVNAKYEEWVEGEVERL